MKNIMFLCTGNSCRSQMAEGFCRKYWGNVFNVFSAGTKKHGMNERAMKVMQDAGVDISTQFSKTTDELPKINFDYVITVCDHAHENCPYFPAAKVIHMGFQDPPTLTRDLTDEEEILSVYRKVRDEIEAAIKTLPATLGLGADFWDDVYANKTDQQMSWFQEVPHLSIGIIDDIRPPKDCSFIDIGGGDSRFVDELLRRGYKDLTVLDISSKSLERAKARLGEKSQFVQFVASDVTEFSPLKKFSVWHDRAAFHFLTDPEKIQKYVKLATDSIESGGFLIMSTFSKSGPQKCSGLNIKQYSVDELVALFGDKFSKIKSFEDTHSTPWGSTQDFVYCVFKRI